jgi:predicted Zn-dependent peptidase
MRTLTVLLSAAACFAADVKIPFERYKLDNGLRVILARDPAVPVVAVYMIYDVGARAEQKTRTGFAHLFEHMMFQGSTNAPKGVHFQMIESSGGVLNGSTHPDYTDYFQVLPSNKLAVALWLESDRMRGLNITEENLTNQKEAVKQERRLRADNQPYVTAIVDVWPELMFRNWGSAHSIIGSFEDLNAATVKDVAEFFKTFYAPNNAVLSIAGALDLAESKKLIASYFSDIPAQPQPKRPDLTEPPITEPRYKTYNDPLAKVPAVVMGWLGPKRRSDEYYALAMLDVVLTGGDSSRFQQNLVKGKQSVIQYESNLAWPFGTYADYKDPDSYAMNFLYKPNFTSKQIVSQVEAEIERIQKEGVPAPELERARTFLRAARINELQNVLRRATLLAQYELLDNRPDLLNTELSHFMAVTSEQIKAVATKYLGPNSKAVLEILPAPKQEATK